MRSALWIVAACMAMAAQGPQAAVKGSGQKSSGAAVKFADADRAIAVWNVKPNARETTAAMKLRVRKDLATLLDTPADKLDYDVSYWKLLAFLRETPWNAMPPRWRQWYLAKMPNPRLTGEQRLAMIDRLKDKPIYRMTPKEVDVFLGDAHEQKSTLRERVMLIARKQLGQPYQMYLLGEFPYEVYDPDPLYTLGKSDCVVFSEHTYAMALGANWKEFFSTLQKLRYRNGEIGMLTRNHWTELDWDKNNSWLLDDATEKLGATTTTKFSETIDKAKFFANFGIGQDAGKQVLNDSYIPAEAVEGVLHGLKDGDFVNVVRGRGAGVWVGHTGLIGHAPDGTVTFIHSTPPKVKEQPLMDYVRENVKKNAQRRKEGKAEFLGFKFLSLREDAKLPQ